MLSDLRYAFRTLTRSPFFAFVAVLSLALGIGANTAIFSLADHVFLRPLPVANPDRLVLVKDPGPHGNGTVWSDDDGHSSFSHPVYTELRDRNEIFAGVDARGKRFAERRRGGPRAQMFDAEIVSGNYFETLGVMAAAGRLFNADDDRTPGAHPVVVLSHSYWQRHFAGRRDVINFTVRVNAFPMTVVGVAAPGFTGTQTGRIAQLFVPMMMKARATPGDDNLADHGDAADARDWRETRFGGASARGGVAGIAGSDAAGRRRLGNWLVAGVGLGARNAVGAVWRGGE